MRFTRNISRKTIRRARPSKQPGCPGTFALKSIVSLKSISGGLFLNRRGVRIRAVLLLGWVQLDLNGLVVFRKIVRLPERLVIFGVDLNQHFSLRDSGKANR